MDGYNALLGVLYIYHHVLSYASLLLGDGYALAPLSAYKQ